MPKKQKTNAKNANLKNNTTLEVIEELDEKSQSSSEYQEETTQQPRQTRYSFYTPPAREEEEEEKTEIVSKEEEVSIEEAMRRSLRDEQRVPESKEEVGTTSTITRESLMAQMQEEMEKKMKEQANDRKIEQAVRRASGFAQDNGMPINQDTLRRNLAGRIKENEEPVELPSPNTEETKPAALKRADSYDQESLGSKEAKQKPTNSVESSSFHERAQETSSTTSEVERQANEAAQSASTNSNNDQEPGEKTAQPKRWGQGLNFFGKRKSKSVNATLKQAAPEITPAQEQIDISEQRSNSSPSDEQARSNAGSEREAQEQAETTAPENTRRPLGSRFGFRKNRSNARVSEVIEETPVVTATGDAASTTSRNNADETRSNAGSEREAQDQPETTAPENTRRPLGSRFGFRKNRSNARVSEVVTETGETPVVAATGDAASTTSRNNADDARSNASATASVGSEDNRNRLQKTLDWSQDLSGLKQFRKPGSDEAGIGNGAIASALLVKTPINAINFGVRAAVAATSAALAIPAAVLLDAPAAIQKRIVNRQERSRGIGDGTEAVQDKSIAGNLLGTAKNQGIKSAKALGATVGSGAGAAVEGSVLAAGGAIAGTVGLAGLGIAGTVAAGVAVTGTAIGTASVPVSGVVGGVTGAVSGVVKGGGVNGFVAGGIKGAAEGVEEATRALRGNEPLYERKDRIRDESQPREPNQSEDRGTLAKIATSPLSAVPAFGSAIANSFGNSWTAIAKGPANAFKNAVKNETTNDKLTRQVNQLSESNRELRTEITNLRDRFQNAGRNAGNLGLAASAFADAGKDYRARGDQSEFEYSLQPVAGYARRSRTSDFELTSTVPGSTSYDDDFVYSPPPPVAGYARKASTATDELDLARPPALTATRSATFEDKSTRSQKFAKLEETRREIAQKTESTFTPPIGEIKFDAKEQIMDSSPDADNSTYTEVSKFAPLYAPQKDKFPQVPSTPLKTSNGFEQRLSEQREQSAKKTQTPVPS